MARVSNQCFDFLFIIQIELPEFVTCRQKHTIANFMFSPNLVWVLVVGGYKKGSEPVLKPNNIVLIKLGKKIIMMPCRFFFFCKLEFL